MSKLSRINNRTDFLELMERIPVQSMISMEVLTWEGSSLEGVSWDYLKYIYNKEKNTNNNICDDWNDYTYVYKDLISADQLLSDFDELQKKGTDGSESYVSVIYDDGMEA